MAVLEVLRMGHPLLRTPARDVSEAEIASPEFRQLVDDMVETMHAHDGVGLAAPQVGTSLRLAIIELETGNARYSYAGRAGLGVYINPTLTVTDDQGQTFWEGCLSVPGLRGAVTRPRKVTVDFTDLEGSRHSIDAEDFLATVFQHEFDHLDGVLYIDRITDTRLLSYVEEFHAFFLEEDADVEV